MEQIYDYWFTISRLYRTDRGKTIFICDTSVIEYPDAKQLADMAKSAARVVRLFGFDPKVAFLSHSTFGKPLSRNTRHVRDAIEKLKKEKVDFDFDGEMQPDVALNPVYREIYPFSKIVGSANVLIMPSLLAANISFKLLQKLGGGSILGPLMIGGEKPFQIVQMGSSVSDIVNSASIATYNAVFSK